MKEVRPILHDVLNALAIARGLSEGVQSSMQGEIEMTQDQQLEKLKRSIQAMDRIEDYILQIRGLVVGKE